MSADLTWTPAVIGRHVELINGYAFPSEGFTEEDGMPLIRIRDLNHKTTEVNFSGKYSERYIVKKGDLLIGMDGDFLTIRWKGNDALLNQRVCKLVSKDQGHLDQDFFFYRICEEITAIHHITAATTVKHLSSKDVLEIEIDLPAQPEQTKIAEILSTVDSAIEQTEALIAKQQCLKTGLMQDLLTRGIDAHGNLRTEQTHEFKVSPLGRIPVEWDVCSLESVADFVTSGSRGWARYYSSEGALFLRIGNLTRHHINMRLDDLVRVNPPELSEGNRTSVVAGDLLISITADLGIIAIIPDDFEQAYVNQHIALVRLTKSKIDPRFVGWFLASLGGQTQFEKLNESGAKAGLNLSTVKNLLIPKMEIIEQSRIAAILDAGTQKATDLQQRLTKLRFIKIALMQDLLTGRKRVTALLPPIPAN